MCTVPDKSVVSYGSETKVFSLHSTKHWLGHYHGMRICIKPNWTDLLHTKETTASKSHRRGSRPQTPGGQHLLLGGRHNQDVSYDAVATLKPPASVKFRHASVAIAPCVPLGSGACRFRDLMAVVYLNKSLSLSLPPSLPLSPYIYIYITATSRY